MASSPHPFGGALSDPCQTIACSPRATALNNTSHQGNRLADARTPHAPPRARGHRCTARGCLPAKSASYTLTGHPPSNNASPTAERAPSAHGAVWGSHRAGWATTPRKGASNKVSSLTVDKAQGKTEKRRLKQRREERRSPGERAKNRRQGAGPKRKKKPPNKRPRRPMGEPEPAQAPA